MSERIDEYLDLDPSPMANGESGTSTQPDPFVRVRGAQDGKPCAVCGSPLPEKPARKARRCCSGACRMRKRRQEQSAPHETGKTTRLRNELLALLRSGSKEWTPGDLTRALGATWAAISPRLRDLRKARFGGYDVKSRVLDRHNGSWRWVYWLNPADAKREVE